MKATPGARARLSCAHGAGSRYRRSFCSWVQMVELWRRLHCHLSGSSVAHEKAASFLQDHAPKVCAQPTAVATC